jgi:hypothetical protein
MWAVEGSKGCPKAVFPFGKREEEVLATPPNKKLKALISASIFCGR